MSANRLPYDASLDVWQILDPGNGGVIPISQSGSVELVIGSGAETTTLPRPENPGTRLTINAVTVDGGSRSITATGDFDESGSGTVVFNNAGEFLELVSVRSSWNTNVWRVVGSDGVTGIEPSFGSLATSGRERPQPPT